MSQYPQQNPYNQQGPPNNQGPQPLGYGGGPPMHVPGAQLPKGMAVTALVTGIVGISFGFLGLCVPFVGCVALICAVLAIIFGAIGLSKANAGTGGGKGMAVTGLILGLVSIILFVIAIIIGVAAVASSAAGAGG